MSLGNDGRWSSRNLLPHGLLSIALMLGSQVISLEGELGILVVLASYLLPTAMIVFAISRIGRDMDNDCRSRHILCVWGMYVISSVLLAVVVSREESRRATQVARAIERFRDERGYYPVRLVDLTPHYLKSIPASRVRANHGCEFLYVSYNPPLLGKLNNTEWAGGCVMNDGEIYDFLRRRWIPCTGSNCPSPAEN